MDERSLSISRLARAIGPVVLLLGGCTSPAPPLPPDTTGSTSVHPVSPADFAPADLALTCPQIADERASLKSKIDTANGNIAANRQNNEVAGYIGSLIFLPAYLATEGNYADKDAVKAAYARQDVLNKLDVLKRC